MRKTNLACLVAGLFTLLGLLNVSAQASEWRVKAAFELGYADLQEVSGITQSRRFDNVYWVHNDSGDSARIFAIDGSGAIVFPPFLKVHGQNAVPGKKPWKGHEIELAAHYDWEDITTDGNWLYIADTGNNGNARRDLGIYKIADFNPRAVEKTRTIDYLPVQYPDQTRFPAKRWHFDAEALFFDQDKLYLITKHRRAGRIDQYESGASLYRLDLTATPRPITLTKVDSSKTLFMVTGAELSPAGSTLAVLGARQLSLFPRPLQGDAWFQSRPLTLDLAAFKLGQVEAITWVDERRLWVTNESGAVFEVSPPAIGREAQ